MLYHIPVAPGEQPKQANHFPTSLPSQLVSSHFSKILLKAITLDAVCWADLILNVLTVLLNLLSSILNFLKAISSPSNASNLLFILKNNFLEDQNVHRYTIPSDSVHKQYKHADYFMTRPKSHQAHTGLLHFNGYR